MVRKIRKYLKIHWKLILAICVLVALGLVAARLIYLHWFGYIVWLPFTGLEDKTLWNVAELFIIPLVLAGIAFYLEKQERNVDREIAEKRAEVDREIALDNQRETALQNYIDSMTSLILNNNLKGSEQKDPVREIAQIKTITTLEIIDSDRKSQLVRFLCEVGLINSSKDKMPIINLKKANLYKINLKWANLQGVNFEGADLRDADLTDTILQNARFVGANMTKANLGHAILTDAQIGDTNQTMDTLKITNLTKANLNLSVVYNVDWSFTNLEGTRMPDGKIFNPIDPDHRKNYYYP